MLVFNITSRLQLRVGYRITAYSWVSVEVRKVWKKTWLRIHSHNFSYTFFCKHRRKDGQSLLQSVR